MEKDRNTVMYNLSQLYDTLHPRGTAKAEADEAANAGKADEESYKKIRAGYIVLKQEAEDRENELKLLRNLASTGLVITSFAHELKNIAILSDSRSEDLRCAVENIMSEDEVAQLGLNDYENPYSLIRDLRDQDQNIRSWLNFSINSINRDKRTRKVFGMDEYFEHFKSTWHTVLNELNIDLSIDGFTPEMRVKAFIIDLDTIFNNLLSNAIYAIKESKRTENRRITINGKVEDSDIVVLFEDTGIGLAEEYKKLPNDIFNAFESSKYDKDGNKIGTGLGLYITKATLAEYKGSSISVMTPRTEGFGLKIKLKMF
jgi:signal transduction histidine kinase